MCIRDSNTIEQIRIDAKGVYNYELVNEYMPSTKTMVQMYWTQAEEQDRVVTDDVVVRSEKFNEVTLYVKVTCMVGEEASTIISTYRPQNIKLDLVNEDYSCLLYTSRCV